MKHPLWIISYLVILLLLMGMPLMPTPVAALSGPAHMIFPGEHLTGIAAAELTFDQPVHSWRLVARRTRPGQVPDQRTISLMDSEELSAGRIRVRFDTSLFDEGGWTLRLQYRTGPGMPWADSDLKQVSFDNRPGCLTLNPAAVATASR